VAPVNIEKVKEIFTKPNSSQFWSSIEKRKVIQWGGLSDPFCWFEKKYGVGLKMLEFFVEQKYPISFSTKGTWFLKDKRYMDLLEAGKDFFHFKVSIISLDEKRCKIIERSCPTPQERLEAVAELSKMGIETTLRLRPFIIGLSDRDYLDLIRKGAEKGAKSVSTEFFCLETRARGDLITRYNQMSRVLGYDILKFYSKYSNQSGYRRLNYEMKTPYINRMKDLCKELGIGFYVSDAHHKEKCDNGCCCGMSEKWNYSRGQFCEALMIAKKNGEVRFSDIAKDMEHLKFDWYSAHGFNTGSTRERAKRNFQTMFDYIREIWNTPTALKSPYRYFNGVITPYKLDDNGDLIYRYNVQSEK
jgi:DNA repair photolyase